MKLSQWLYLLVFTMAVIVATEANAKTKVETETDTEAETETKTGSEAPKSSISDAKEDAENKAEGELDQFGFGPAFYVIKYDSEVLSDSKDVRVRGDGTIDAKGTNVSTSMGIELHYDFSFNRNAQCFNVVEECKKTSNYTLITAHRLSPFLGLYDLDNGIKGIAVGLVYGYIKKDTSSEKAVTLNAGIGWTIHKDRLVLGNGLRQGMVPPAGLSVEDYTERKDVEGLVLMVSANMGF